MANTYFIRLRGNVQGPFDAERLRQLARRGQFTRLHEVSVDGREWKPAGECLDLFSSSAGTMLTLAAAATSGGPLVAVSPAGVLPSGTAADGWYYELGGQAQGPVDLTTVQRLVEQGQVTLHSRVWRPGMANWTPAADVPQLAALLVGRAPPATIRPEPQPVGVSQMYCPKCGTPNNDNAFKCVRCGAALQVVAPTLHAYNISSYLVPAILATIFCCLPLGIPAIVYATQVNSRLAAGDIHGAIHASKAAKMWTWISFGLGLVACGVGFLLEMLSAIAISLGGS